MKNNFTHTKWDTFEQILTFKDKNWVAIDLNGSEIKFSVKKKLTDTVYIINHTATITDYVNWTAEIKIDWDFIDMEVGTYYYDIQWTDSTWFIRTLLKWNLTIDYHVTE